MADCLVTVTGTSGSALIRYVLAGEQNNIIADFGDSFIIPDTATVITTSTLSGDAVATGAPCTINPLAFDNYTIVLKSLMPEYKITGFFYNGVYNSITTTDPSDFANLKIRIETAEPEIVMNALLITDAGINSYGTYAFTSLYPVTFELKSVDGVNPDGRILVESIAGLP